jgi:hypothetical protein
MPNVEMPDGKVIEFPDSMKTAEINAVLDKEYNQPQTQPKQWKEIGGEVANSIAPIVRPALEYGGMAAGGVVGAGSGFLAGAGLGAVPGAIVGAGLGYAGGKKAADIYDRARGVGSEPKSLAQEAVGTAKDVAEGATMEAGGAILGKGIQKTGQYALRKAPEWYESALKIIPSTPKSIRDWAVKVGMEGKYIPTEAGLLKLQNDIDGVNKQIFSAVENLGKAGKKIDTAEVLKRVDKLKEFYQNAPDPTPYLKQLEDIKVGVLKYRGESIPTTDAQKIKQTIYALNRKHYGEMKSLEVESNKAIARGLKEEIVKQNPQIGALNAKDSALINLEEYMERAVSRIRNKDIISLGETVAIGAGALSGSPAGAAKTGAATAGILKRIIDSPGVKARISFALSKAGRVLQKAHMPGLSDEQIKASLGRKALGQSGSAQTKLLIGLGAGGAAALGVNALMNRNKKHEETDIEKHKRDIEIPE